MQQLLEEIKRLCAAGKIVWTNHVFVRMMQRGIEREDVKAGIMNGEIIENNPDAYPYPSCLLLSLNIAGKPLHIVCGITDTELWIVTAYRPDPAEWEPDFKTRKGGKI